MTSILVGARTPEEIAEDVRLLDHPVPEELWSELDREFGVRITGLSTYDVRFPTSRSLDGSDAMHRKPDYSAAYVVLHTDSGASGHGLTFTNGRGTEVCVAAVRALEPLVAGRTLDGITGDMRGFWRSLASDDQLRWLGPEKGVIHLAVGAVVNAVWDLWAKEAGVPLWQLLTRLPPEDLVAAIDFRYIEDALSPDEALDLLRAARGGQGRARGADRRRRLPRLHHVRGLDRLRATRR